MEFFFFFESTFKSLCRLFGTIEISVAKKDYGVGVSLSIYFKAEMYCSLILFFDGDVSFFLLLLHLPWPECWQLNSTVKITGKH